MLYTAIRRYEDLTASEQKLYLDDKELYDRTTRKNAKGLYFAGSGMSGETWIPLIEKAYAKIHGNYDALRSGCVSEAMEDLTGYAHSSLS